MRKTKNDLRLWHTWTWTCKVAFRVHQQALSNRKNIIFRPFIPRLPYSAGLLDYTMSILRKSCIICTKKKENLARSSVNSLECLNSLSNFFRKRSLQVLTELSQSTGTPYLSGNTKQPSFSSKSYQRHTIDPSLWTGSFVLFGIARTKIRTHSIRHTFVRSNQIFRNRSTKIKVKVVQLNVFLENLVSWADMHRFSKHPSPCKNKYWDSGNANVTAYNIHKFYLASAGLCSDLNCTLLWRLWSLVHLVLYTLKSASVWEKRRCKDQKTVVSRSSKTEVRVRYNLWLDKMLGKNKPSNDVRRFSENGFIGHFAAAALPLLKTAQTSEQTPWLFDPFKRHS